MGNIPCLIITRSNGQMAEWHQLSASVCACGRNGAPPTTNPSLGSLFNHSEAPNVSFSIGTSSNTIQYTVSRIVLSNEELCIFYGQRLWFQPAEAPIDVSVAADGLDREWKTINSVFCDPNPFLEGYQDDHVPESELPFRRTKVTPDDEEEDFEGSVRTGQFCLGQSYVFANLDRSKSLGRRPSRLKNYISNAEVSASRSRCPN